MGSLTRAGPGQALREARERAGMTQTEVGRIGLVHHSMISHGESGRRKLASDVTRRIAEQLDDGRLFLAVIEDAAGGAGSPWLDGPAVDLGRVAVWCKTAEELAEALKAMERATPHVLRPPDAVTPDGQQALEEALMEVLEAITACHHAVAVACREYGLSYRDMWERHRQELRAKGYLGG